MGMKLEQRAKPSFEKAWASRWSRRLQVPVYVLRREISLHPGAPRVAIDQAVKQARGASDIESGQ